MTTDEKLAAILAAVQTDPGNRGLAEMFAYCPGDFEAACRSIADQKTPMVSVLTGFVIPTAQPPAFETDGPLGAVFLGRAFYPLGIRLHLLTEPGYQAAIEQGLYTSEIRTLDDQMVREGPFRVLSMNWSTAKPTGLVILAIERVGPAKDSKCYTMRGRDITAMMPPPHATFLLRPNERRSVTIGIGDGGNEIGMGKIPHEIVAKNIPNGDLIHCRVPTDYLIVAGVSNWGAYALAAGVYVLRGVKPPADLFDPDRERKILEVMVREGPLVDGVTGEQTATVDGLSWEEYVKPMIRIREILES
jgi:D-glutamate cyclase